MSIFNWIAVGIKRIMENGKRCMYNEKLDIWRWSDTIPERASEWASEWVIDFVPHRNILLWCCVLSQSRTQSQHFLAAREMQMALGRSISNLILIGSVRKHLRSCADNFTLFIAVVLLENHLFSLKPYSFEMLKRAIRKDYNDTYLNIRCLKLRFEIIPTTV